MMVAGRLGRVIALSMTDRPDLPGILRSVRMTSKDSLSMMLRASSALEAA